MVFKVFKQAGKEVIFNLDNIVFIKMDEATKKTVIFSNTHSNEVDVSLEEIKEILGAKPMKEIGF